MDSAPFWLTTNVPSYYMPAILLLVSPCSTSFAQFSSIFSVAVRFVGRFVVAGKWRLVLVVPRVIFCLSGFVLFLSADYGESLEGILAVAVARHSGW
ncbi:hypothetical protein F4808DRAFT_444032 [Astrocystis sublimbata]|nr:hypothetical protein F4808DRAFT_444032 [Astrocystis sublimbata]